MKTKHATVKLTRGLALFTARADSPPDAKAAGSFLGSLATLRCRQSKLMQPHPILVTIVISGRALSLGGNSPVAPTSCSDVYVIVSPVCVGSVPTLRRGWPPPAGFISQSPGFEAYRPSLSGAGPLHCECWVHPSEALCVSLIWVVSPHPLASR